MPLNVWNVLVSLLTVFSTFSNLHITAFETNALHDHNNLNGVVLWQLIQEYAFGIDIIVTFFTEYDNNDGTNASIIRDPKLIAKRYLTSYFIIDLLAFFPFYEVFRDKIEKHHDGTERYNYFHLLFLFRLLRLYKATELLDPAHIFRLIRGVHQKFVNYK